MELFHVLNRGVEKRDIFMDDKDRIRFIHNLYEFNDAKPAQKTSDFVNPADLRNPKNRSKIIDIHGWCLMKNHYHILLSERVEGGITLFLRKINIGYANYFNERYKRSGALFQGRTKKILIDNDAYFLHILNYIHLNPLDYMEGSQNWRMREISDFEKALSYLESYRWSSYLDYCEKKNFPSILTTNLFQDVFGNYKKEIESYLHDLDTENIRSIILE